MAGLGGDRTSRRARGRARALEADILRFYLTGKTMHEIAVLVNMTERGVNMAYARALRTGIAQPEATVLRREAQGRLEVLRRALFEDFDAATDPETRGMLSDRILRIEQRLAALLGLDVPQRFSVGLYPDATGSDSATVEQLKANLSVDELREMVRLSHKATGTPALAIETTATPAGAVSPDTGPAPRQHRPSPPFFDEPDEVAVSGASGGPNGPRLEIVAPVRVEIAPARWSPFDREIAALEDRLVMLDANDSINRQMFEFRIREANRRRDQWLTTNPSP